MPLPTGTISMSQVNVELGLPSTTTISLNQSTVRALAGIPSGTISMNNLRGKSASKAIAFGINAAPWIRAAQWSSTGFGTLFADPTSVLPSGTVNAVKFANAGNYILLSSGVTPWIHAYIWNNGFGTKLANPSSLPSSGTSAGNFDWSPSDNAIIGPNGSTGGFWWAYQFSNGFGSRYTSPGAPGGNNIAGNSAKFFNSGNYVVLGCQNNASVSSGFPYAWTFAGGFGTRGAGVLATSVISCRVSPNDTLVGWSHSTNGGPRFSLTPFNGTAFTTTFQNNPATGINAQYSEFNRSDNVNLIGWTTLLPGFRAFPVSSSGYGSAFGNPATVPTTSGAAAAFDPNSDRVVVSARYSGSATASLAPYPLSSSGWGTIGTSLSATAGFVGSIDFQK